MNSLLGKVGGAIILFLSFTWLFTHYLHSRSTNSHGSISAGVNFGVRPKGLVRPTNSYSGGDTVRNSDSSESVMKKDLMQLHKSMTDLHETISNALKTATGSAMSASRAEENLSKTGIVNEESSSITDTDVGSNSAVTYSKSSNNERSSRLHTVTYASHGGRDDRFCRAVESAVRHNFNLVILGWGLPWKGLSQKLEAAHEYAASLPSNDLLLFTDAFDVLFSASPSYIEEKFFMQNYTILFSAECGCWPHLMEDRAACFDKYPQSPTPYRYLNSGSWVGKASLAAEMLAEVIRKAGNDFRNANDQKLVADMYISGKYGIQLDFYNNIFQSMHMTLDAPLPYCNPRPDIILNSNNTWYNKRTKATPAVFHFNGGGKRHHLSMEGMMWYKNKRYSTNEEKQKLASHLLSVPSHPSGKLRFDQICSSYIKNKH